MQLAIQHLKLHGIFSCDLFTEWFIRLSIPSCFSPQRIWRRASPLEWLLHRKHVCWDGNLDYIDSHFVVSDNSFFISTGRENRDVKILIDAFSKTNASLEIYVNKRNYNTGNNYSYLEEYVGKYPNIKIVFMEDTELTYEDLCQRTAEARCVVVPLIDKRVNYCVGLTSVVEAMALGKPIISSPNPYSPIDLEKEEIGFYASTVDEWMDAITRCTETKAHEMGCRARKLAGETYNIHTATTLLDHIFSSE